MFLEVLKKNELPMHTNTPWTQQIVVPNEIYGTFNKNVGSNEIYIKQASGVSHYGLAIYIKKYLKAKEEEL
jgi:hypothetical protein